MEMMIKKAYGSNFFPTKLQCNHINKEYVTKPTIFVNRYTLILNVQFSISVSVVSVREGALQSKQNLFSACATG